MPIEIDPATGAPITTPATVSTDNGPSFVAPTTDDSLHSSVDIPAEGTSSDEGTDGTDSTIAEASTEVKVDDGFPKSRAEFLSKVRDIVSRYSADSQAAQKCEAEIAALIPD